MFRLSIILVILLTGCSNPFTTNLPVVDTIRKCPPESPFKPSLDYETGNRPATPLLLQKEFLSCEAALEESRSYGQAWYSLWEDC